MPRSPTSPLKAHHRLLRSLVKTNHKKQNVSPTPAELDRIARVFVRAGGSWERTFKGSIEDVELLKRVIKVAIETGRMSKAEDWG